MSEKYQAVQFDPLHLLKSLVYFVEADMEPMPQMLVGIEWDAVKRFFVEEARRV